MEVDLSDVRARRDRSPSFPFIPLDKAVERARIFSVNHRRSPARLAVVGPTWGYAAKSSGLLQTVAALKAFGLLEDISGGEDRKVQLTDLAWRLLLDARPGAKEQAIREAAMRPKLIAEYMMEWVPVRPSDEHCISELQFDRGFNEAAAKIFLRVFDETVAFANLRESDNVPDSLGERGSGEPLSAVLSRELPRERTAVVAASAIRAGHIQLSQRPSADPKPYEASPESSHPLSRVPRATMPLPEGVVALELPSGLSEESLEDIRDWVEVLLRRADRAAKRAKESGSDVGGPTGDRSEPDNGGL